MERASDLSPGVITIELSQEVEPTSGGPEILTVKRPIPLKVKGLLWDRRASVSRTGPQAGCFDSL